MCEKSCPSSSSGPCSASTNVDAAIVDHDDTKGSCASHSMLPWPEDHRLPGQSFVFAWYQRFTYSYMNRVLRIGAKQEVKNNNNGTYLSQDDLYFVPPSMESQHLIKLFS